MWKRVMQCILICGTLCDCAVADDVITQDIVKLSSIRKEAEQGIVASQVAIGILLFYKAEECRLRCNTNESIAMYRESMKWLEKAADMGDIDAMSFLKDLYNSCSAYGLVNKGSKELLHYKNKMRALEMKIKSINYAPDMIN